MLCSSIALFLFSLAFLLGFFRIYVISGCFLGFLFFKLTVGRFLAKVYCPVISFFGKISRKIRKKIKNFTKKLLKNGYNILYNISKKIRIFGKVPQSAADDIRVMDSNEKENKSFKKFSGSSKSRKHNNKGNKAWKEKKKTLPSALPCNHRFCVLRSNYNHQSECSDCRQKFTAKGFAAAD